MEAGQGGTVLGNSEQRVETEPRVKFPSQDIPLKPQQPRTASGGPRCQAGAGGSWPLRSQKHQRFREEELPAGKVTVQVGAGEATPSA